MRWVLLAWGCAACAGTASALAPAAAGAHRDAEVLTITQAMAWRQPERGAEVSGLVTLSHRWDREFPGQGGQARYRIELPPAPDGEAMALLFTRVGNQVAIRFNGQSIAQWGRLGEPGHDAAKAAHWLQIPPYALNTREANVLEVDVTIQASRWGGLSTVSFGPMDPVLDAWEAQHAWRWRQQVIIGMVTAVMGVLAGLLWWRQKDPLYGTFALAALLGAVRPLDRVWADIPVPWPWWGALAAAALAGHLACLCRFVVEVLGLPAPWLRRAIGVVGGVSALLGAASIALHQPWIWSLGLALLIPVAVASWAQALRKAWSDGSRLAWWVVTTGALALLTGLHDLGLVRLGWSGAGRFSLLPLSLFLFLLLMAGLIVHRYTHSLEAFRQLSSSLAERLAAREAELNLAFQSLRQQEKEQAVQLERQRMMREIHDGVGAQLVGLLNLVQSERLDRRDIEGHIHEAMDEMRMAVDSLQPVHGDLATVLGTLRWRLQPRFNAAGLGIRWEVDELPRLDPLGPAEVLQIQRILLETFTNILKHAQASEVTVRAWSTSPGPTLHLLIRDDGCGFDLGNLSQPGHGLSNLRARALALGAQLELVSQPGQGCTVVLHWSATPAAQA